jgi:polar amino acid transport system substrate-binding protein
MDLPEPSPEAIAALAPTGTLRAAINLSNFLLVTGESSDGHPEGVSPDLAAALAERLDVGLELLRYESPGEVADDGNSGRWDIGNIASAPQRTEHINFTAAYCEIEATYLVRAGSGLGSIDEVDQPGRTIVAPARAAYGLWLERNISQAELKLVPDMDTAYDTWVNEGIDALGALRPGLFDYQDQNAGSTILDGRFAAVQQSVGAPKERDSAGFEYLGRFVEAAKASGLVAELVDRHEVTGRLTVAPLVD